MNIKTIFLSLIVISLLTNCDTTKKESVKKETEIKKEVMNNVETPVNTLSEIEKNDGWVLLFDGKTSEGWRGYKKDYFPNGWIIENGTIQCLGSGRGEAGSKEGGDIIFDKEFQNFELSLEWKISKGGNSGIFYLGEEKLDYIWKTAPEMQILDNVNHPDAEMGIKGNRKAGSLYDLISADPQNAKPFGEWNKVEIIVFKGTVIHKMNGETVLEYHLWTPEWNNLVAGSKFPSLNKDWADVASKGYFGLQDHGDDVWFKNIKIKEL